MTRDLSVLHVEDDLADAMLLQHALQDASILNLKMEVARTLRDARSKMTRRHYDLIIADLRLPDSRDPNDTVSVIRRSAGGAPILVLTGSLVVDAERIGSDVTVLDKNVYFHNRDDRKSQALRRKIIEATETAGDDDGDTLML